MRISLWFQSTPEPELVRVEFERHPGKKVVAVRRKAVNVEPDIGSFQWTAAVKALSCLIVKSAAELGDTWISGEAGSPAASLDYAISKPTSWIVDMFGREQSGRPSAQFAFRRENSERKLPGPVRIALARGLHEPEGVQIFLDNRVLTSRDTLAGLVAAFDVGTKNPPEVSNFWYEQDWFRAEFIHELEAGLKETYLLEPSAAESCKAQCDAQDFITLISAFPALAQRYGRPNEAMMQRLRSRSTAIRVAIPPMAVGAYLLFNFLREREVPLHLDAAFPSSSAIVEEIADTADPNFDAVVLSWGALKKRLLTEQGRAFVPCMLLPKTGMHLVWKPGKASLPLRSVLMATEPSGYPYRYFESLKSEGHRISHEAEPIQASFAEIFRAFSQGASGAIFSFPLSVVAAKHFGLAMSERNDPLSLIGDNVLCIHHRVQDELQCSLLEALRLAWFELLEKPEQRHALVEAVLQDCEYGEYLNRLGGLYALNL